MRWSQMKLTFVSSLCKVGAMNCNEMQCNALNNNRYNLRGKQLTYCFNCIKQTWESGDNNNVMNKNFYYLGLQITT